MKKIFLLLLFAAAVSGNMLQASEKWLPGPDPRWHTKLEPALEQAKRENKFVYVLSTGSDWCAPCIGLKKDVLDQAFFETLVKNNLVPVYLDSPSKRANMPQSQRDHNDKLIKQLRIGGGVPAAALLDSDGNKLGQIRGYKLEPIYISEIYKILKLPYAPQFPAIVKFDLKSSKSSTPINATVEISAWGSSPLDVVNKFNSVDIIDLPPGKDVFFKVDYTLPENIRAVLRITDREGNRLHSDNGIINESGCYIFKAAMPESQGMLYSALKATVIPENKSYRRKTATIPSRINLDAKKLSEQERRRFKKKKEQERQKFAASEFKIISWGTNRKTENPYSPGDTIFAKDRHSIYIRVRYQMPGPAAIGIYSSRYPYLGYTVYPASGERVFHITARQTSKLYVSLRPRRGEILRNIITIPCNIVCKK